MSIPPLQALGPHFSALSRDGRRIGIAVSGGGDSLALLDLAHRLAQASGGGLLPGICAVTLDHGLRPEAADEARMVAAFCAARGISHQVLQWQGWDGSGNLQAEARKARYRLIADWGTGLRLAEIWLGHTLEDVAETLLIRLGRAAGLDGLSQMAPVFQRDGMTWRRPLLGVARADLRAHLRAAGIAWAEDPSNDDPGYARVRARQLLPLLAPLGITAASLAQSAGALRASRALIEEMLIAEWQGRVRLQGGDLCLELGGAGPEMSRRLVQAALQWMGGQGHPLRQAALGRAMAAVAAGRQATLGGSVLRPEGQGGMRLLREWRAVRDLRAPLAGLWDGRWSVTAAASVPVPRGAEIRALGHGIVDCPDWRASGLCRASLQASPAVWDGDRLLAAPLAQKNPDWQAKLRPSFASGPFAH